MTTGRRILKNTVYLYLKMGITGFISFYSTRLILSSLGASDFGIFNIIGGAIGMLGFLNSTMANATQRFISYAEGKGDIFDKTKIFNISIILHLCIAILTVLLLLIAMIPLFNGILNISPDRIIAAKVVYYSLIFSTFLTIVNVPYESVMNAHENMLYYSLIGIFEAFLRLIITFICVYTSFDKLIVYAVLVMIVPIITLSIMKIYCHKHYEECKLSPRKYWDNSILRQIASFSTWNFLTAISSLITAQGNGLILNHFFGTILNASQGIANQLNNYLSSFSLNMMKAFNPVIVKNAGCNNISAMNEVMLSGCKFSTYLIMFFSIPCTLEINYILKLWLGNVPEWTSTFCILVSVQTIITQMASSVSTAIYAQGNIKWYAIYKSLTNILPIIITYFSYRLGGEPYWLYIPMIIIWGVGGNIVILKFAKNNCQLKLKDYYKKVLLPVIEVASCMLIFGVISKIHVEYGFTRFIITFLSSSAGMFISLVFFGLTPFELKEATRILCLRLNIKC